MSRTTCSQKAAMRKLIVVELRWMSDPLVDGSSSATVFRTIHISVGLGKHPNVMPLSDDDKRNLWLDPNSFASSSDFGEF